MTRERLTPSERVTARRAARKFRNLCRDCGEPVALVWPRGGVGVVKPASQCEKHLAAGREQQRRRRERLKAQPELGTVGGSLVLEITHNDDGTFNLHTATGTFLGCQITGFSLDEEPKP